MRRVQTTAYVLCTALSLAHAFTVESEPVRALISDDPRRVLQQTYVVSQPLMDSMFNHETLQTLKIAMPGRVFVSYNYDLQSSSPPAPPSPGVTIEWPTPTATIRFSGSSDEIFKHFEVVSTAPQTIEVRRRANVHGSLHDAYLLTEISVSQSHSITGLSTSGTGDVIIEDQVLASDGQKPLNLQFSGSGNVYIDSTSTVATASVHITSKGSGSIHWTTGAFQTESYKVELAGSGDVTMMGQALHTTSIEVAIAGSGDVCVDTSDITTNTLVTATAGSGTISFSSASGHCSREDISILGSGEVYTGSIQCNDAKVTVAGAGDIYVQAVQSISGTSWGAGDVRYVGVTPQQISDRYDANVFSIEQSKKYHPIAKFKDKNKHTTCHAKEIPLRAAAHVQDSWTSPSSMLGLLIFFALIAGCYLRSQVKRTRRSQRGQVPRFGSYHPNAQELQPLQQQYQQIPYQPQQKQQQQQRQSSQVYV